MPKIGNGLRTIDDLSINQYAWASSLDKKTYDCNNYDIVYESEKFKPWKLITKK